MSDDDGGNKSEEPGGWWAIKPFRRFLLARAVSLLGGSMTWVALTFVVLQHDGLHLLGPVLAAQMVPLLLLTVVGGGVADRISRRVVLTVSNLAAGAVKLVMALVLFTDLPLTWLIPLAALNGAAEAFTTPALRGIVPELVPTPLLSEANSVLSVTRNLARLGGPGLAGLLVATVDGGLVLAFDGLAFLVAGLVMATVPVASVGVSTATRGFLGQLAEGWSWFRAQRWIWATTVVMFLLNIVQVGVLRLVGPVLAESTPALGPERWGLLLSVNTAGLLVAGVVLTRFRTPPRLQVTMALLAVGAAPMVLTGTGAPWWGLLVGFFLAGVVSTAFAVSWDTTLQSTVPNDKISRVSSYDDLGSYLGIPLAQLAAIPLGTAIGFAEVAVIGGLVWIPLCLMLAWWATPPAPQPGR